MRPTHHNEWRAWWGKRDDHLNNQPPRAPIDKRHENFGYASMLYALGAPMQLAQLAAGHGVWCIREFEGITRKTCSLNGDCTHPSCCAPKQDDVIEITWDVSVEWTETYVWP